MSGHTITKLGQEVHLRVAHTSLTSHAPGMGLGKNVGLKRFCQILTLMQREHPCFTNTSWFVYNGQKLELIYALKVLNEGFTIWLHVHWLWFRVRVLGFGLGLVLSLSNSNSSTFLTYLFIVTKCTCVGILEDPCVFFHCHLALPRSFDPSPHDLTMNLSPYRELRRWIYCHKVRLSPCRSSCFFAPSSHH